jgi:ketosteroid isomerase-like protein
VLSFALGVIAVTGAGNLKAAAADDEKAVAALDTAFQLAVKNNDAATIERTLAPDMVLVTGRGKIVTAADHVEAAKTRARTYEQQDEVAGTQKVRVFGDTAIVTALLWIKGTDKEGKAFDYKVWFSDTYVRTPKGWKYFFGQASIPLPKES